MAKIKLGMRPEIVTLAAKFEHLDGTKDSIKVAYRYRTRAEFAEFIDSLVATAEEKAKAAADSRVVEDAIWRMSDTVIKTDDGVVDQILEIATGWDLDEPFDREHVAQLVDEYPAAASAIIASYRSACLDGRRGN